MRDYVCRKHSGDRYAFMVKDDETETITVYGKYDEGHGHFSDGPEVQLVADVPQNLIDEIEERPTWDSPMSEHLREFTNQIWETIRQDNPWFSFV